jgi:hypothetical protein
VGGWWGSMAAIPHLPALDANIVSRMLGLSFKPEQASQPSIHPPTRGNSVTLMPMTVSLKPLGVTSLAGQLSR